MMGTSPLFHRYVALLLSEVVVSDVRLMHKSFHATGFLCIYQVVTTSRLMKYDIDVSDNLSCSCSVDYFSANDQV